MFPIRQSTKTLNESGLYKMKFHANAAETENGIKPFVQTNVHISIKIYISTVEISSLVLCFYICRSILVRSICLSPAYQHLLYPIC